MIVPIKPSHIPSSTQRTQSLVSPARNDATGAAQKPNTGSWSRLQKRHTNSIQRTHITRNPAVEMMLLSAAQNNPKPMRTRSTSLIPGLQETGHTKSITNEHQKLLEAGDWDEEKNEV